MPANSSTAVLDRPSAAPSLDPASSRRVRARRWLHTQRTRLLDPRGTAVVLAPLLVAAAAVLRIGLYTAPQRIDDEGTYVAQAWAVFHLGELTHYTYWYDHPPLGWLQIAVWTELTHGFERAPNAIGAGRELMAVLSLVSAALLWMLARRLDLPRWAAGLAVALFSFSPLAVQYHRTVYLDNVATPWLLGAFVLVLSPRRRLGAFAGAAVCFAVAVLSKETTLLLLPVLAWLLWHRSRGETRRYAVAVTVSLFALVGIFYLLFAALKGEVVPGADKTSLLGGIGYQLGGRDASGSIFDVRTLGHKTVTLWLQLDVVLPALALVATPLALAVRRLRPFAVGMLILLAMLVRPGYLPVPFVIALLPLGALLVAGVTASAWQHRPRRLSRLTAAAGIAVALAVGAVAAPAWASQLRGLTVANLDAPLTQATAWIDRNVPRDERILTDDALWVDLVEQGRSRDDVVWFYKPDTDPAVPKGADSYQWVVSTDSVRSDPASFPTLQEAIERGRPVATFGTGERRVEILRVQPTVTSPEQLAQHQAVAAAAGQQLVTNPALRLTRAARDALLSGRVDPRLLTVLASTAAQHRLAIDALPQGQAATDAEADRRTVRITAVDGEPVSSGNSGAEQLRRELAQQPARYQPDVELVPAGDGNPAALVLTYPLAQS